ncbi:MAG: hypothetical protein AAGJ87_16730 [Pseudomonadota bacterium]
MAMAEKMSGDILDPKEQQQSYNAVMKFGAEVGVPFSLGLTMFFTQLVMGNGWWAVPWFIIVYLAVWFIVKTFFSH